ncbi:MAG: sigma-54-dependent transcriptional regulator [Moorellaceae bacterium]
MECPARILVVDDEREVGVFFKRLFERKGYKVALALNGRQATAALRSFPFHVALVDLKLPDTDGLSLLQEIKSCQPGCEAIIMTGYSTTRTAVKAMQLGAYDYIEKPFEDISEIEVLIEKALSFSTVDEENKVKLSASEWYPTASRLGIVVGHSQVMNNLFSLAYKIARRDVNILIQGETGVGKEVLARFIHAASHRAGAPFVAVNCGALPENILESELFGHERGAFTGAVAQKRGIFELANGGTLFLDEIGEASPSIQVKLLRVLETGEFMRVGGEKVFKTNVRIIAATNVDLEQAVKDNLFRKDLFYRLDVIRLVIPPLRDRKEDIPALIAHFLRTFNNHELPYQVRISPEASEILTNYSWPGNIRELVNVLRQAAILCDGHRIEPRHLPARLKLKPEAVCSSQTLENEQREGDLVSRLEKLLSLSESWVGSTEKELQKAWVLVKNLEKIITERMAQKGTACSGLFTLGQMEKELIRQAVICSRGNLSLAAKFLGIGRSTLYRKLRKLGGSKEGFELWDILRPGQKSRN